MPGVFHVLLPDGRIEGGSVFGQYAIRVGETSEMSSISKRVQRSEKTRKNSFLNYKLLLGRDENRAADIASLLNDRARVLTGRLIANAPAVDERDADPSRARNYAAKAPAIPPQRTTMVRASPTVDIVTAAPSRTPFPPRLCRLAGRETDRGTCRPIE
jgi:hypothetical protein